jgi:hypothetical protein
MDITDNFDDILEGTPAKEEKPWLENPNSADYKPRLTAMLDLLRGTGNGDV